MAGPPTLVSDVTIAVSGPAQQDVIGSLVVARIQRDWGLPIGEIFRQPAWTAAKTKAVTTLAASPFAAARLTGSEAHIDPDKRSAELAVEIDSGPAFHFGAIGVQGNSKYPQSLVRDFSTIREGDLYSERALDEYIRRLLASGYFASAQASIVPDAANAGAAPVTLAVIEAPAKKLEIGVGYSTDTQWKASGNYSDVNIDGHGLQFYADARVETKLSSGSIRFVQPPKPGGWLDAYIVGLERTDIENLVTRTASVSWRRRSIDEISTPAFGAGFFVDQQQPKGSETEDSHETFSRPKAATWRTSRSAPAFRVRRREVSGG